jgi:SAM-dependent methyltransferase
MKNTSLATGRAHMPAASSQILDQRTLETSYRSLSGLIEPGMTVLDVGCGTGAITCGMAKLAGATSKVIGLDASDLLISQAREKYRDVANLSFTVADIRTYHPDHPFDLVASARTLQWLADPFSALQRMSTLLRNGGWLSVLDYNHEKIRWNPAPPASMQLFYRAFLQWRADAGMLNDIADHLPGYFREAGLQDISVSDQSELTCRTDADYLARMGIWAKVAETRGLQLVADDYVTEAERLLAVQEYKEWMETDGDQMEMYIRSTDGRKPAGNQGK